MFSSLKLIRNTKLITLVMFLIGFSRCFVGYDSNDNIEFEMHGKDEKKALVSPYEVNYSKCCKQIENFASDKVLDFIRKGENRSFVGIETDNSELFWNLRRVAWKLNLNDVSDFIEDHEEELKLFINQSMDTLNKWLDTYFAMFKSSSETSLYAQEITKVLEDLRNEGFVDTSDISEFFKKAYFKCFRDFLGMLDFTSKFIKESYLMLFRFDIDPLPQEMIGHYQARYQEALGFHLYLASRIEQQFLSLKQLFDANKINLSSFIKIAYEIEKIFAEAQQWFVSIRCNFQSIEDLASNFDFTDAEKNQLFEFERSAGIAFRMLEFFYETLKAAHLPKYKLSAEKQSEMVKTLCSHLYSIPFSRNSFVELLDMPAETESVIAN